MKDYYQLLNVSRWASPEQIKQAYREHAKHFHPDRHQNSPFFTERFREIQEAYEVLSDARRRADYDARQSSGTSGNTQAPPPRASAEQQSEINRQRNEINQQRAEIARQQTEIAHQQARVQEMEAELRQYQWLDGWRRRTDWFYSEWRQRQRNWRFGLLSIALLGIFWLFTGPFNRSLPIFLHSGDRILADARDDLRYGNNEKVISEVAMYLSTRYGPANISDQQRAALFVERARAKVNLENDSGAIRDYSLAVQFDLPDAATAYAERGVLFHQGGSPLAALKDFSAAIHLDSSSVAAYKGRAMLHFGATRYHDALADYQQLCRLQPMLPEYRKMVACCYWKLGEAGQACRHWQQAAREGSRAAADSAARHCIESDNFGTSNR